tara:strand:+ start:206 stop:616 length:411 start_codon:yes stop_codon:yes gene_type:complete
MIEKIKEFKLKKFKLSKGDVLKGLNKNDKCFYGLGEVYFSFIKKNQIKGWKKHTKMKMNLFVPIGKVEFRFYSEKQRKFKKIIIGEKRYFRISVPNNICFAFKGLGKTNLVMNVSNIIHTKNEAIKMKPNSIKFND